MVRIISQNFSPPRSRHSSGETDRDLAERTKAALSSLGGATKHFEIVEYESSSDSFWDSEFDGEHSELSLLRDHSEHPDINGNDEGEKSDLKSVRKDRRRERNKLSAQLYRKRRRHQSAQEAQVLTDLATENRRLHKLVHSLEKETEVVKKTLRSCSLSSPGTPLPEVNHRLHNELKTVPEESALDEAAASTSHDLKSRLHTAITKPNFYPNNINNVQNPLSGDVKMPIPNQFALNANENLKPSSSYSIPPKDCNANANSNMSKFNLFPAQILTAESLSKPEQSNQILLQAHGLIGAAISRQDGTNFSACAIPAYVAVPVESSKNMFTNTNLNLNMPYLSTQMSPFFSNSAAKHDFKETKPFNANSSLALNSNVTYNVASTNLDQNVAASKSNNSVAIGVVKVQLCNSNVSNNFSSLKSDNNANTNCDNFNSNGNQNRQSFPQLNLNLNCNADQNRSFSM